MTAEPFLGDDPFVMYLGDNLIAGRDRRRWSADFRRNQPEALILSTKVPDPQNFGVARARLDRPA